MATMSRREITTSEHSTLPNVSIRPETAHALRTAGARLEVQRTPTGGYSIKTRQVVGTVRTHELDLIIRPKVDATAFLELLGYSPALARLLGTMHLTKWDDFLPALARLYAHSLGVALRRGVLRGYRRERAPLSYARGQIDVLALATKRFGVIPPIDCEFEEFSADIEVNQRLKAAATLLVRSGFGSDRTRGDLRASLVGLEGISERRFRLPLPLLPLDRRLTMYGPATDLANLVLSNVSLELQHGDSSSVGFLVNMDDLYEAWVGRALGKRVRRWGGKWQEDPKHYKMDRHGKVRLLPDMVWSVSKKSKLPIDAKYKRGAWPNSDIYQMAAYCGGLRVKHGVLFYVDVPPDTLHLENGVTIHIRRLSIEGDPERRSAELDRESRFLGSLAFPKPVAALTT